jgi:hypothetical protein
MLLLGTRSHVEMGLMQKVLWLVDEEGVMGLTVHLTKESLKNYGRFCYVNLIIMFECIKVLKLICI